MEHQTVLIIDDEDQIRRLLKVTLSAHGFTVIETTNAKSGLEECIKIKPDLVILDMGLPDKMGLEVIKDIRQWSSVPIIMISVKESEQIKIEAFDAGADDYVVKPFGMGELMARIRAALRHASKEVFEPELTFGDIRIDLAHRYVYVNDIEVKLTPTEYELFKILTAQHGKVVTQSHLLKTVWGDSYQDEVQYLRVYITQLRKKLEKEPSRPQHIITEPGVGYRFI